MNDDRYRLLCRDLLRHCPHNMSPQNSIMMRDVRIALSNAISQANDIDNNYFIFFKDDNMNELRNNLEWMKTKLNELHKTNEHLKKLRLEVVSKLAAAHLSDTLTALDNRYKLSEKEEKKIRDYDLPDTTSLMDDLKSNLTFIETNIEAT